MKALLFVALLSVNAHAKMAATRSVPAEKLVKYLEKQSKTRKLGELEKQSLELARLGRIFGAEISRPYTATEEEAFPGIGPADVAASLHGSIPADWTLPLSPEALKRLRKDRKLLESYLGARSAYDWAWVRYELGEKIEAKKSLGDLYSSEFEKVMQLKEAVTAFGHGPLSEADLYYKALKPMSAPDEAKEVDDKMQKMKVHVSNLPQHTIVT